MQTLLMLQGLPGSGKTTLANQMIHARNEDRRFDGTWNNEIVRVNKDDIRRELEEKEGWVWSHENEKRVIEIRDMLISNALKLGHDVVSDDTNLGTKHRARLKELADLYGAVFEVRKLDVPIEECIRRDAQRIGKAHVGSSVIRRLALQSGMPAPRAVVPDEHRMPAIICDLDGTLSLFKGVGPNGTDLRDPYDASTADQDVLNRPVKRLLEIYYRFMHYQIIYLSGRKDCYRPQTETFLRTHHCPPGPLYMRKTADGRKDCIVKSELFDAHVRDKYRVEFVLDDRDQVVEFWRSIGLTCFQVADGAF